MLQASFAAIEERGQILLVRSLTSARFKNAWSVPGGLVESGEAPAQAAVREAYEETGISCQVTASLMEFDALESALHIYIYAAQYLSGHIVLQATEIAAADWFSYDAALRLPLAYNTEAILKQLISRQQ
jgi:mutator protein MutT